jgi:hypothetical protein
MTYEEMFKLASDAAPDTMADAAMAMKLAERMDPESVKDIVKDFTEISERIAVHTKVAGLARDVGTALGVTVVGGLGLALATDLYSATRRGLTKARNWKRMIEANPNLLDPHSDDGVMHQERLRPAFNSIHRFAPDVASDPLAAGAAVRQLADSPSGTYHANLKNSVDVQKTISDSHAKPFVGFLKGIDVKSDKGPKQGPGALKTNHPRG